MKRSFTLAALAAGALIFTGLAACMSSSDDNTGGSAGNPGQGGATNQGGGAGTTNNGGSAGTTNNGGNAGSGGTTVCMEGQPTTVKDIATGVVATKTAVKFTGLVTAGPVVTYASDGKPCGYAIFVKDQAADYGTMIYAKTTDNASKDASGNVVCPAATNTGLIDGVAAGDVIEVNGGTTTTFGTTSCGDGGAVPTPQVQVNVYPDQKDCVMKKTGTAAVTPVKVTDFAGIVAGKPEMQGMLVEIDNVDAEDWPDGGAVGPYGIIKIAGGSGLEIHDKFYYSKALKNSPVFCPGQHFNKITGIVHLDYCDWVIQPLDPTKDFDPPSPQTTCQ